MLKNFVKGLAVGATVGGTLGILLAPKSGKQLTQNLTDEIDEATALTVDLNNSLQRFQLTLTDVKQTATQLLPDVLNNEKLVEKANFQITPRLKEIKKQMNKIKEKA